VIRFLADENISPRTADFLRSLGYDVVTVAQCGLTSRPDEDIVRYALENDRVILTFDLDFGTIYYLSAPERLRVLVLRLKQQTVEAANEVLKRVVASGKLKEEIATGWVMVATKRRIRCLSGTSGR